jgi:hypothetical protein
MEKAVAAAAPAVEQSLVACAAAACCGSDPATGIPAAVASHLLQAALLSHVTLPGFGLGVQAEPLWAGTGEASAILAGDALIPLAMRLLARTGFLGPGLVREAAAILGRQALAGLSLELDLPGRAAPDRADEAWRTHAGSICLFAAGAGALAAGADGPAAGRARTMGLAFGRACTLLLMPSCPSRAGMGGQAALEAARALFREAVETAWSPAGARIAEALAERVLARSEGGADLFEGI